MTNATKPFIWQDRDTFARDLIQLVYHAPSEISARALRLLEHLGSAAVEPDLHALVLDADWPPSMRVYALRGVINSPGDVHIPEIRPFLDSPDFQRLAIGCVIKYDALGLADRHPSNRPWLLDYVEHMPPEQQRNTLCDFLQENRLVISPLQSDWRYILCDCLINLLKIHPALLDLHAAGLLHRKDDRDSSQEWLTARIPAIVKLCLEMQIEDIAYVLDEWERLKQGVFAAQPELFQVYHSYNTKKENQRNERRRQRSTDLTQSNTWRALARLCDQANAGDERTWKQLVENATVRGDALKIAAAVHLFGKLPLTPAGSRRLLRLLNYAHNAPWVWKSNEIPDTYVTHYPVLYEICEVLAKHPSPGVWAVLLDIYFAQGHYTGTIKDWVLYQTECLIGLDEPLDNYHYVWPAEERIWFKALVEAETCDS